ncbi:hypothetical protein AMEX_G24369 [Astyanax mexicanus]|uniref:Uncharacterized protein n=1 Tax=Astyanax mexicanus TaxID=7994 RepID=A0A8T2KZX3_ASTMX|nr:hypothetical protein AMEX_G24369 [Astyanax mexicanus]
MSINMEKERSTPVVNRIKGKTDEKYCLNAWHCMSLALHQIHQSEPSGPPQSFLAQQRLQTQSRRGFISRPKL